MTLPGKTGPLKAACRAAVVAIIAFPTGASAQSSVVADGVRIHLEQSDLQSLAKGIGEELATAPVTGELPGPVTGSLGFAEVSADGIQYSLAVVAAKAEFNGSTGIASHILAENLVIDIDRLTFNESGTFFCDNLRISSGPDQIPISMDLRPAVDDKVLKLNPDNIHIAISSGNFQSNKPRYCETPWGLGWLLEKIAPWVADSLRPDIAAAIAERITNLVNEQTNKINQTLTGRIDLPFVGVAGPAIITRVELSPNHIVISADAVELVMAAAISMNEAPASQNTEINAAQSPAQVPDLSWVGVSEELLTAIMEQANAHHLLSPTFSRSTMPSMSNVLSAKALMSLIPDAASRFNGTEDVEIKMGQARGVKTIFKPNGPGGIPIIDVILQKLPVEVVVDGETYFATENKVRFRFAASIDEASQRLELSLVSGDCDVSDFAFNEMLVPKPVNRKFDSTAFVSYLEKFTKKPQQNNSSALLPLPGIHFGTYKFSWSGSQIKDRYLVVSATLAK